MLRLLIVILLALAALAGPAECSENPATVSPNGGQAHVAALRPPGEVIVDDNGNLTDDGQRLFFYDYKNRLVGVSERASGDPIASYEYLADGRRAKKVVYSQTTPGQVQKATAFFYDGAQEVEEQDAGSGATEATYVWSPVYVDELVTYTNAAGTFYTHQDARCDVVAITDAAGNVVERVRFDDFGKAEIRGPGGEVRAVSAVGCAYGFQGRRLDAETGLLYFRARYYDSATGRFLQRDPVWDAGNVGGQYTFCGNGPVSGRDPFGLQELSWDRSGPRVREDALLGTSKAVPTTGEKPPCDRGGGGGGAWLLDLLLDDFRIMGKGLDAAKNEFESGSALVGAAYVGGVAVMAVDMVLSVFTGGTKEIATEAGKRVLKEATEALTEKLARDRLAQEAAQAAANQADETVDLYRAVSPGEFDDIMSTGTFRPKPDGRSLEGKQFGRDLDEVIELGGHLQDAGGVVKVKVPKSTVDQLDQTPVDPNILKSGSVTAQGGAQQDLLNATHRGIEQAYP